MKKIQLSEHFTYSKLIRFTLPSMIMMVFSSIYGVVDGFFVSNFVGKTAFTAVNFILPVLMILGSVGFMFGTGGGALIAKTMGEGDDRRANELFSLIVYTSIGCGVVLAGVGFLLLRPLAQALGAEGAMLQDCIIYGSILLPAIPAYVLQYEFQCLCVTAEKPNLGLAITVASGLTNMVLDALFVAVLPFGLPGAAAATALSQCVGGIFPLIYFARPSGGRLRLGRTRWSSRSLFKACTNGSSELMSNISMSLVSMLYNAQLLHYAGEDGIAAYGVLMYVSMIFQALFIGYSVGTAPVVSFHYGAGHHTELRGLLRKSASIVSVFAVVMFVGARLLAAPLSHLFVRYDAALLAMTNHAFSIFSFCFLFSGYAIFGSSFFTALNNGLISAAISFLRTLVFQIFCVLVFPLFWQVDGIWASLVAAEAMAVCVTLVFLRAKQKNYGY